MKPFKKYTYFILFCCLTAGLATNSVADEQTTPTDALDSAQPYSNLPVNQVSNLAKVFDLIKQSYVEEVDDNQLLGYAIQGMVEKLDPHSSYFDTESLKSFNESTTGKFIGLGIEITLENGAIKVVSAFDNTPAQKAGLRSGDIIYELDGQIVQGLSLRQASQLMRGEIGTSIEIKVQRENEKKPLTFNIVRDEIKSSSVRYYLLNDDIAYTRISSFQSETGEDFEQAILDLKNTSPNLKALILDLRNNPGGLLQQAVKVSDVFLQEKLVVYTKGRTPESQEEHYTSLNTIAGDLKLVVLINPGSASASEIVAGAMQDHNRAVIMGETSFGKASVQKILYLDKTSAIKLTIARYFTPNGTSIQANGIVPDVIVKPSQVSALDDREYVSESQLAGHLKGDTNNASNTKHEHLNNLSDDFPLQQAFQLLQGALILQ